MFDLKKKKINLCNLNHTYMKSIFGKFFVQTKSYEIYIYYYHFFYTELCKYYVFCQPLGKSCYINIKNPPVHINNNVHVHHSNFQIVLENYTMEKNLGLLAILCHSGLQHDCNYF